MSATPLELLAKAAHDNCVAHGDELIKEFEKASRDLLLWLNYLETSELTNVANCLLAGVRSALNEAASSLCLGLVRPSLNSLRLETDLLLGWMYFKDHPKEWERVSETGDGYKLKSDVTKYLSEHYPRYSDRFGTLLNCSTRSNKEPYRLLSAHIHGQSEYVLPVVNKPADIVATPQRQKEVAPIQAECAEYLGDVLWSVYADRWASFDESLVKTLAARFKTPAQKAAFFAK